MAQIQSTAPSKDKGPETHPAAAGASTPQAPQAPRGFRRVSAVDDAPWFQAQEGNLCHGHVAGRHIMNVDPPRAYYQIELKAACKGRVGKGEEAKIVDCPVGTIVNLNETKRVEVLREKVAAPMEAGGDYDVWILFGKKRKIGGAKTMWSIDVQVCENKAPTRKVEPLKDATTASDEDDDSPF